jgi:hypothetical protein
MSSILHGFFLTSSSYLPDVIKGDLDSIRDDVRYYYQSQVCKVDLKSSISINNLVVLLRVSQSQKTGIRTPQT